MNAVERFVNKAGAVHDVEPLTLPEWMTPIAVITVANQLGTCLTCAYVQIVTGFTHRVYGNTMSDAELADFTKMSAGALIDVGRNAHI